MKSQSDLETIALECWDELSDQAFNCQELHILLKYFTRIQDEAMKSRLPSTVIKWPTKDHIESVTRLYCGHQFVLSDIQSAQQKCFRDGVEWLLTHAIPTEAIDLNRVKNDIQFARMELTSAYEELGTDTDEQEAVGALDHSLKLIDDWLRANMSQKRSETNISNERVTPNDVKPAPDRCKHDVHGKDCFECYPAPQMPVTENPTKHYNQQKDVTDRRLSGEQLEKVSWRHFNKINDRKLRTAVKLGYRACEDRLLKETPESLHKENLVKGKGDE